MNKNTTTEDTAEMVCVPALPVDDRTGDGYDWLETTHVTPWSVMGAWGSDGWDAGSWPYVFFLTAQTADDTGALYGYGKYVEGDLDTHWFRNQDACYRAITADVFWFWKHGQADGPTNLPDTAEELAEEYTKPYVIEYRTESTSTTTNTDGDELAPF